MTAVTPRQDATGTPRQEDGTQPGKLFILSAPSGTGKTTLCGYLRNRFPDFVYSISHTTRPPREEEQDGKDYHFTTAEQFQKKIDSGSWAEWAEVHGNYYGTSAEFIDRQRAKGHHVLLDIDVQGAAQIRKRYPGSITIFIMPPSMAALKQRLTARGTDTPATVAKRLRNAGREMDCSREYQHVVINDQLEQAVQELIGIVEAHRQEA